MPIINPLEKGRSCASAVTDHLAGLDQVPRLASMDATRMERTLVGR